MRKLIFTLLLGAFFTVSCSSKDIVEERYLASTTTEVRLYAIDEDGNVSKAQIFVRGRKVKANYGKGVKIEKQKYYPVEITRKQHFYAKEQSLVATAKEVVKEKSVWVRTPASIITNRETSLVGAGRVSHKQAQEKASAEYLKYQERTLSPVEQVYFESIKVLAEKTSKKKK